VLAAAGCGGVQSFSVAPPPATTVAPPAPPETLPPGLASVPELAVPGVTTTTAPAIGPGPASLNGTVNGPAGAVAGATVEVDRFVGDVYASARTTTAADGTWSFRNLLGGDYRVRAWLAPTLDMDTPQTVFLAANQPQSVALQLTSYAGNQVEVAINPSTPVQNQPTNLVVQVTDPTIDGNGVLTAPPLAGAVVTLVDGPGWQVNNGNPLTTDSAGHAVFQVECTVVGTDPLSAQVGQNPPVTLRMPSCAAPPPTTTVAPPYQPTTTTCPPANPDTASPDTAHPDTGNGNTSTVPTGAC
jgi:hypothetical protein